MRQGNRIGPKKGIALAEMGLWCNIKLSWKVMREARSEVMDSIGDFHASKVSVKVALCERDCSAPVYD